MGEVWSAVYAGRRGFSKPVALKLLRTPHLDSETAVMFVDEARAAGELSHPAVVPTFDLGRDGPFSYIAMELVNGAALNVLLKRLSRDGVRLSPGAVAYVGERIASALDYGFRRAQAEGQPLRLVHRDVSPHNILVDDSGAIRLTDFGIARTAIQKHATAVGKFRGKAGYLSPEQVTGQPLDDRSDVFSLCIVLWECATGRRLFRRKTLADSIAATREAPAPRLTTMVPGFPFALSDVIAQGLAKRDIAHVALTGSTPDRRKPLDAFADGKADVFLISLKAGGTGLNLTNSFVVDSGSCIRVDGESRDLLGSDLTLTYPQQRAYE